jgi:phosphoribosylformylglycinamidine synthase I
LVKTCVITGFGINADIELEEAFKLAGSSAERVHINDLILNPERLHSYHILAFPGGFSFGDHLGSGIVFANLFKKYLKECMQDFIEEGKIVIGLCNGFQVLVKMGLLPNLSKDWEQEVSLIHNDSGKFEDRWVKTKIHSQSACIWTEGITTLDLPVRHGEGKFITKSKDVLHNLKEKNLITLKYTHKENGVESTPVPYPDNPNGSEADTAGICDETGRIFGLMPHPEAFIFPHHHPGWKRKEIEKGWGLSIFENGVEYVKNKLL